jgi:hypothetical protein
MDRKFISPFAVRLLKQQRDKLLEELRALAPDVVAELELTMEALERGQHDGFDH